MCFRIETIRVRIEENFVSRNSAEISRTEQVGGSSIEIEHSQTL